ncbi:hypothetical protein KAR04_03160 [Candidatus Calescamantes bacterium]|nr:hypothetical protein [Candidatus Calescamantes bacterium]MCK5598849.1 hypothetical protein [bacterium]
MKIICADKELCFEKLSEGLDPVEIESYYKDAHGKEVEGVYSGILFKEVLQKNTLGLPGTINVYAKDGYKMTIDLPATDGAPMISWKFDGKDTPLTFMMTGNADGRFRVVDIERIVLDIDLSEPAESVDLNLEELNWSEYTVGKKQITGISVWDLLKDNGIEGRIIKFIAEDNYFLQLEKDKYLKDAYIRKENMVLMGLSLKLGNWMKFVSRIAGTNKVIRFK